MAHMHFIGVAAMATAIVAWSPAARPTYTEWSPPVHLGPVVNSPYADYGPALSKDGLQLYFVSDRPGGSGAADLWVSLRASVKSPWSAPCNLGSVINSEFIDGPPHLSRDGHWLFFNSNRPGGAGDNDLWMAYRAHTHDPFGWEQPLNAGEVNSAFADQGASYFANDEGPAPLLWFGSSRPGGPGLSDIYVAELRADGTFAPASLVAELSSPDNDHRPSLTFDGLEVFFFSDRLGSLGFDLWGAVRTEPAQPWSVPENLGLVVNSAASDQNPHIAADRQSLYFASNRPGATRTDLYVTTRTRKPM
jgi:Tol biopolymer transport system component